MLFCFLKDAHLACKRCPLRPLLTPFWSPIKHFLKSSFITRWFTDDCKLTFYTYFSPILGTLYLKSCNIFSTLSNDIKKRSKRAKQTLFRPSFIPLFTFKIWGISHFTPLPMGEGSGEGPVVADWLADWLVVCLLISPPTPSANVLSHHDTALPVGSRGLLLPASWG